MAKNYRKVYIIVTVLVAIMLILCCYTLNVDYDPRSAWDSQSNRGAGTLSQFTQWNQSHSRGRARGFRNRGHLLSMPELITLLQNGKWPVAFNNPLSDSEVAMVAGLFRVGGLIDSSVSLQRQFLKCPARHVFRYAQFVDGRFVPTEQYQTCKKLSFKKQRGVVGLISYPGSGNSWVRQLLETSTGVFTGSVYCDKSYIQAGMFGEGVRSEFVVAVKCHNCRMGTLKQFSKVIYVVRNPFDTFLAEFTREAVHVRGTNASSKHVTELEGTVFSKWHALS